MKKGEREGEERKGEMDEKREKGKEGEEGWESLRQNMESLAAVCRPKREEGNNDSNSDYSMIIGVNMTEKTKINFKR